MLCRVTLFMMTLIFVVSCTEEDSVEQQNIGTVEHGPDASVIRDKDMASYNAGHSSATEFIRGGAINLPRLTFSKNERISDAMLLHAPLDYVNGFCDMLLDHVMELNANMKFNENEAIAAQRVKRLRISIVEGHRNELAMVILSKQSEPLENEDSR